MLTRSYRRAALYSSAVFVSLLLSPMLSAQAPIIDASSRTSTISEITPSAPPPVDNSGGGGSAQGQLFYQLQLLQREVMQLRGIVEEQANRLKRADGQSMERYLDIDKRLAELASNRGAAAATTPNSGGNSGLSTAPPDSGQLIEIEGEKVAYDRAYSLVVSKRFYEALVAFKQFLVDYPLGKYAPNSYYWMGELYQVVKPQDLEASRQSFTQLLDQYPDHSKVPDAMYKLGKVYFLKDNKAKSREWLERVIANYGQGKNVVAADKARQFVNSNF